MKKVVSYLFVFIFIISTCLLSSGCITKVEVGYVIDLITLSTNSTNLLYLKFLKIENSELQSDGHNAESTMFKYEERYLNKNFYKLSGAQNNAYFTMFNYSYGLNDDEFSKIKINDDNNFYFLVTIYLENGNGYVYKNTTFNELRYYKVENKEVLFYNNGVYEDTCTFEIALTSTVNISMSFKVKQTYIYN